MRLSLLLTAAVLLSACASSTHPTGAAMAGGMPAGAMAPPTALSDADILAVFIASNAGEIVTSQAVLAGGQSADVRQYAQRMIDAHTAVNERARALRIAPRDNAVSASMTQNATAKAAQIGSMSGAAKDMAYVETQVVLHGNTLDMLTNVLIPNARDPQLKALMTETRPDVEAHLRDAERTFKAMPAM